MMEDKVQLIHPTKDKKMPRIDRIKYEALKGAIVAVLKNQDLTHNELLAAIEKELKGKFQGSVSWYGEGVKLDLEAHKIIERIPAKPHEKYHLV